VADVLAGNSIAVGGTAAQPVLEDRANKASATGSAARARRSAGTASPVDSRSRRAPSNPATLRGTGRTSSGNAAMPWAPSSGAEPRDARVITAPPFSPPAAGASVSASTAWERQAELQLTMAIRRAGQHVPVMCGHRVGRSISRHAWQATCRASRGIGRLRRAVRWQLATSQLLLVRVPPAEQLPDGRGDRHKTAGVTKATGLPGSTMSLRLPSHHQRRCQRAAVGVRVLKRVVKQAAGEDYRSEAFGETLGAWP
jgi:hypothetical protein